jgi:hypothetical protein
MLCPIVSLAATLCWADPRGDGEAGLTWSARAGAHQTYYLHCTAFGPDAVERFCHNNDLDCIVRGHEVAIKVRDCSCARKSCEGTLTHPCHETRTSCSTHQGWSMIQNRRLITVFSATRYCGTDDNNGGILQLLDRDRYWRLSAKYLKFSRAGPHPDE